MSILPGLEVDVGHRLDDCEEAVAGVELFDLIGELEALEGVSRSWGKAVHVRHEVRRDVLGIPEQPGEGVRARVVQRVFPLRIGGLAEQAIQCRFGHLLRL